jgi:cytochrome c oxidase assembly protein subunit 15
LKPAHLPPPSGLAQEPENNAVPRVSPYRLAAHLMSAFTIYGTLVWTTLSLALPTPPAAAAPAAAAAARSLRAAALPVAALVAVTAGSGAFVAGMDAGHAYNTFPTMNGEWLPSEYFSVPGGQEGGEGEKCIWSCKQVVSLASKIEA